MWYGKKKITAVKERLHLNVKSGNVIINCKDRDWMLSTIENMGKYIEFLEMKNEKMGDK
jgi:methyl coenzyme M reductase subunit D